MGQNWCSGAHKFRSCSCQLIWPWEILGLHPDREMADDRRILAPLSWETLVLNSCSSHSPLFFFGKQPFFRMHPRRLQGYYEYTPKSWHLPTWWPETQPLSWNQPGSHMLEMDSRPFQHRRHFVGRDDWRISFPTFWSWFGKMVKTDSHADTSVLVYRSSRDIMI